MAKDVKIGRVPVSYQIPFSVRSIELININATTIKLIIPTALICLELFTNSSIYCPTTSLAEGAKLVKINSFKAPVTSLNTGKAEKIENTTIINGTMASMVL